MNGLLPHIQRTIHDLKDIRGSLEKENVELSEIISRASGTKGGNQDRINQLGQSIFVLERENKTIASWGQTTATEES